MNITDDNISYTGTLSVNHWNNPILIKTQEKGDTVELFYKQESLFTNLNYPVGPPKQRVFKIVYSCKEGKWHKSDRVYGKIIPAQKERYEFE